MVSETEIRREIRNALCRKITIKELHDWLVLQSKTMHIDSSIEAQELIWSIEVPIYLYLEKEMEYKNLIEMLVFAMD